MIIVPLEDVDARAIETLRRHFSRWFEVRISDDHRLPSSAYDPERAQYHASGVLDTIRGLGDLTQGVTERDLFVPGLNFVFGVAELYGNVALISLYRLKTSDARMYQERIIKEAMHEVGHAFGLKHCDEPRCVMHFSNTIVDTDRKGTDFCPKCWRIVKYCFPER
jgi:archaemetzincin